MIEINCLLYAIIIGRTLDQRLRTQGMVLSMRYLDDVKNYCYENNISLYVDKSSVEMKDFLTIEKMSRRLSLRPGQLRKLLVNYEFAVFEEGNDHNLMPLEGAGIGAIWVKCHPDRISKKIVYTEEEFKSILEVLPAMQVNSDPVLSYNEKTGFPKHNKPATEKLDILFDFKLPRYIISFDTESTGMKSPYDRVISVGMVCFDIKNNKKIADFEVFINPHLPKGAIPLYKRSGYKITKIALPNMDEYGRDGCVNEFLSKNKATKMIDDFLNNVKNTTHAMIAHSIQHDIHGVDKLLQSSSLPNLKERGMSYYCTFKMLRALNKIQPYFTNGFSMSDFCNRYGINTGQRDQEGHGALIDSVLLCQALHNMYKEGHVELVDDVTRENVHNEGSKRADLTSREAAPSPGFL